MQIQLLIMNIMNIFLTKATDIRENYGRKI